MNAFQLFWKTLRSATAQALNPAAVGLARETVLAPITAVAVAEYVAATACDVFPPKGGPSAVPPLFAVRLVHPLLLDVITDPTLRLNLLRMVHAEQRLVWHTPMAVGAVLTVRLEVAGIRATTAGELLEVGFALREGQQPVAEGTAGLLVRAPRKAAGAVRRPPAASAPVLSVPFATARGQAVRYAQASGDHNPIHTSRLMARVAGFGCPILHGMCVLAMATDLLVHHLAGGDASRLQSLTVRFAAPVVPGDALRLRVFAADDVGVPFDVVRGADDKPVLRSGVVVAR